MVNVSKKPVIKTFPETKVIFTQATGPYDKSPQEAWNVLNLFAEAKKLFNENTVVLGMSLDDPSATAPDKCRYEALISIDQDVELGERIERKVLKEGNYAVFTYKGSYDNLGVAYTQIFMNWSKEHEMREANIIDKYLNCPTQVAPEDLLTEIWVPIK